MINLLPPLKQANSNYTKSIKTKLLPIAPYGRALEAYLRENTTLPKWYSVYVFFGANAWTKSAAFSKYRYTLCLPYGADPAEYRWPVKGCSILAIDTGGTEIKPYHIRKLAYVLLKSGALSVHCAHSNNTKMAVYRR